MTDRETPDRQAEQETQQQHSEHINEMFGDSEEEFVYTETSKPLNRNAIVLLLIALVGASMIYLMYLRGRFTADQQIPGQAEAAAKVDDFRPGAKADLEKFQKQLDETRDRVNKINADPGGGQVPLNQLTGNPFGFDEVQPAKATAAPVRDTAPDPSANIGKALQKINVQMVLYNGSNSNVQINNGLYKTGDTLTVESVQFTIASIARDSVLLKNAQGQWTLQQNAQGQWIVQAAVAKGQ